MLRKNFVLITMAASLIAGAITARAQDAGALLDLLVKKRIITDQEAEEVRGELVKDVASTAAGKLKLSTPITEIELYGDARLRYEVRTGQAGAPDTLTPAGENSQRNRFRYRLRLGLRESAAEAEAQAVAGAISLRVFSRWGDRVGRAGLGGADFVAQARVAIQLDFGDRRGKFEFPG